MDTLKEIWGKVEGAWGWAFTWIAAHPKTTAVIVGALFLANFARKY